MFPNGFHSNDPLAYLKRYWGYDSFRSNQQSIVNCLGEGQDALVILPTGAGKSLCFQLPALMKTGLTLVVSPLVSLMENQVEELRSRQIPAGLLHSQIPNSQRQATLRQLDSRKLRLLYLSPETLLSLKLWSKIQGLGSEVKMLVIDEAHCLVQWGTTFRPIYRRLGAIRPHWKLTAPEPIPLAAFTATADAQTQSEIARTLQLQTPQRFTVSPYRPNLDLAVKIAWTPRQRFQQLLAFLKAQGGSDPASAAPASPATWGGASGLIYTRSRRETEVLANRLHPYQTRAYHAGLGASDRRQIEQGWLSGQYPFVICTSAFGMGINKPDVRWVVHYHPPLTLSEYLQEIGRAGRDNLRSQVLMLVSEPTGLLDNHDRQQRQYFLDRQSAQLRQAQQRIKTLPNQGFIPDIVQQYPDAEMTLSLLHSMDRLIWDGPMHYRITGSSRSGATDFRATDFRVTDFSAKPVAAMAQFIGVRSCRWQFILKTFGFEQEGHFVCGHCDRCQAKQRVR